MWASHTATILTCVGASKLATKISRLKKLLPQVGLERHQHHKVAEAAKVTMCVSGYLGLLPALCLLASYAAAIWHYVDVIYS